MMAVTPEERGLRTWLVFAAGLLLFASLPLAAEARGIGGDHWPVEPGVPAPVGPFFHQIANERGYRAKSLTDAGGDIGARLGTLTIDVLIYPYFVEFRSDMELEGGKTGMPVTMVGFACPDACFSPRVEVNGRTVDLRTIEVDVRAKDPAGGWRSRRSRWVTWPLEVPPGAKVKASASLRVARPLVLNLPFHPPTPRYIFELRPALLWSGVPRRTEIRVQSRGQPLVHTDARGEGASARLIRARGFVHLWSPTVDEPTWRLSAREPELDLWVEAHGSRSSAAEVRAGYLDPETPDWLALLDRAHRMFGGDENPDLEGFYLDLLELNAGADDSDLRWVAGMLAAESTTTRTLAFRTELNGRSSKWIYRIRLMRYGFAPWAAALAFLLLAILMATRLRSLRLQRTGARLRVGPLGSGVPDGEP